MLRMCHPCDFGEFFKLKNAETAEFSGPFAEAFNTFSRTFFKTINSSVVVHYDYGLGEKINENGSFNGCIGRLQNNLSDVMLYSIDYPSNIDDVDEGLIFFDTVMTFSQHYFSKEFKAVQILSSISSTESISFYVLLFLTIAILLLHLRSKMLIKYHQVIRKHIKLKHLTRNNHYSQHVFAHAFRFGSIKARTLFGRILFVSLSIYSLIIVHMFNSSIKTNLVVADDPEVYDSFDQLIDQKVKPLFVRGMNTIEYFKFARNGTPEKNFWLYIEKNFELKEISIDPRAASYLGVGIELAKRKSVFIIDRIMAKALQNAACSCLSKDYSKFATWRLNGDVQTASLLGKYKYLIKSDPNAKKVQKGLIWSKFFRSKLFILFKRFITYPREMGLTFHFLQTIVESNMLEPFMKNLDPGPATPNDIINCRSDVVIKSENHHDNCIRLNNIISLIVCLTILIIVSTVVFIFEVIDNIILHKKRSKVKRKRSKIKLTNYVNYNY